jgi:hypothetical protein
MYLLIVKYSTKYAVTIKQASFMQYYRERQNLRLQIRPRLRHHQQSSILMAWKLLPILPPIMTTTKKLPLKSMRVQWTKAKTLDGLIRQILTQMITIIMTMEKEAFIFCPRITCFSWVFQWASNCQRSEGGKIPRQTRSDEKLRAPKDVQCCYQKRFHRLKF